MNITIILLAVGLAVAGVLLRPIGWVVFALAILALVLHVTNGRVG